MNNKMKFMKKPVVVEAIQYTGENEEEIKEFLGEYFKASVPSACYMIISNFRGDMTISKGDYVVHGVDGDFYPCKPDIFEKTYEPVKE